MKLKTLIHPLAAALLLAVATPSLAQTKGTAPPSNLTDTQHKQLLAAFARVDARIEAALAKYPREAQAMRDELKRIAALTDPKAQASAAAAYRARHGKFYGNLLAEAKVSLPALAKELNAILPGRRFVVTGHYTLVSEVAEAPPASAPPPQAQTQVVRLRGLDESSRATCRGLGMPSQSTSQRFSRSSQTARATAMVAGGCRGSTLLQTMVPSEGNGTAVLEADASWSQYAFALGAGGVSLAESELRASAGSGLAFESRLSAVAPVLWTETKEADGARRISASTSIGLGQIPVMFSATSNAVSVAISASQGNSSLSLENATLRISP